MHQEREREGGGERSHSADFIKKERRKKIEEEPENVR